LAYDEAITKPHLRQDRRPPTLFLDLLKTDNLQYRELGGNYTYPLETPQGELLLFYRLGGAGGNSPLAVSRSGDRGTT